LGVTSCSRSKDVAQPAHKAAAEPQVFQAQQGQANARAGISAVPDQDRSLNAEEYGRITENEFLEASNNPLSTFSTDVDTASYSNVRRFINEGELPPADAVRIEELINYFQYNYPEPEGDEPFSISTEVAVCPWKPAHKLVHVGVQGKRIPLADAPPNNLVFLIDTS